MQNNGTTSDENGHSGNAVSASWLANILPAAGGWLLLWFCLIWLIGAPGHFLADGGVARQIVNGVEIIRLGQIPHTNYLWAIDPSAPYTTHELLGDLAIGAAFIAAGLKGVAALGIVVMATALMWSFQMARSRGLGRITGWLLLAPVLLATSVHWLTRSHIFSYLFLLAVYYLIYMSRAPLKWRALWSALVICLWANVHGSFVIGLFMLGLEPACAFITKDGRAALPRFLPFVAAAAASMINIRGPGILLWLLPATHQVWARGGEWHPFDFSLPVGATCFLIVAALLLVLALCSPRRPEPSESILCFLLFCASLTAMRFIPYFVLVALPAMGPLVAALREKALVSQSRGAVYQFWQADENKPVEPISLRRKAYLRLALLACSVALFLKAPPFQLPDFTEKMPAQAVKFVQENGNHRLGFSFDNWGAYLYLKLHKPIFIDDKMDFYPDSFMKEYFKAYEQGDVSVLDKYKVDYVVVPGKSKLAETLLRSPQWRRAFCDTTASVYFRSN